MSEPKQRRLGRERTLTQHILRRLAIVLVLLVTALVFVTVKFLVEGGAFSRATPQFAGTCRSIDLGGATVRDLAIDREAGIAYLSVAVPSPDAKGSIKRLDLKSDTPALTDALTSAPGAFDAQAIALFVGDGVERLLVASRAGDRPTVEFFEPALEPGTWLHAATLRDTRFRDAADLVPVGYDQFYFANRSAGNVFQRVGEMLLAMGQSTVLSFSADRTTTAAQDTAGAGGIAASPDGLTIYVAETFARQIRTYTREPFLGRLTPKGTIKLPGAPMHIDVADDGSLWIAADPRFSLSAPIASAGAPSRVLRVTGAESEDPHVSTIYGDAGDGFAGARVAAVSGDTLLLGSPVESRLLVCKPN